MAKKAIKKVVVKKSTKKKATKKENTTTEEKVVTKKVSKKKAEKAEKPEKPARVAREKSSTGLSLTQTIFGMLREKKYTDEQIAEVIKNEFPNAKHNDAGIVKYHRAKHNRLKPEDILVQMVEATVRGKVKLVEKGSVTPEEDSKPARTEKAEKKVTKKASKKKAEVAEEVAEEAPAKKVVKKKVIKKKKAA